MILSTHLVEGGGGGELVTRGRPLHVQPSVCPVGGSVPCRKTPSVHYPLTLYGHVMGFLWDFDITSGYLWEII